MAADVWMRPPPRSRARAARGGRRLELEPGIDALALDPCGEFLDAAQVARLMLQHLEAPAPALGMALVHPRQIAREKARLLAPGAGPDLQDRGARVRRILGQQRQPQRLFHLGDPGLQARDLLLGERAHLRVGQHGLGLGQVVQRAAVGGDLLGHGLEVGIFPGDLGDLGRGRPGLQPRLEELEPLGDLGKSVQGNHGRGCGALRRAGQGGLPRGAAPDPGIFGEEEAAGGGQRPERCGSPARAQPGRRVDEPLPGRAPGGVTGRDRPVPQRERRACQSRSRAALTPMSSRPKRRRAWR